MQKKETHCLCIIQDMVDKKRIDRMMKKMEWTKPSYLLITVGFSLNDSLTMVLLIVVSIFNNMGIVTAGQVLDDEIYKNLVVPLPKGVKLFMIMDCCHSGSIVDLPLIFKADEQHMIDAANGVATMEPNPKFNMERVIEIGKKLLMMHQSGASATVSYLFIYLYSYSILHNFFFLFPSSLFKEIGNCNDSCARPLRE